MGNLNNVTKVTVPDLEPRVLLPGPGILSLHPELILEDDDGETGGGGGGGGHVRTVVLVIIEVIVGTGDAYCGEVGGAGGGINDGGKSDGELAGTVVVMAGLGGPPQQCLHPLLKLS